MKFQVREEGKDGGAIFNNAEEAIDAAVGWRLDTGVRCEIYIVQAPSPLDGAHSIGHTIEADTRWARYMTLIEHIEKENMASRMRAIGDSPMIFRGPA